MTDIYTCEKCKKIFKCKQNLEYHINDAKLKCDDKNIHVINDKKLYCCKKCDAKFKKHIYLKQHDVKEHSNVEELNEKIAKLEQIIKEKDEIPIIIEQLPTVIVNRYGEDNMDYLYKNDPNIYENCIVYPGLYMPDFIVNIHFNPKYPENYNIIPVNDGEEFDVYVNNKFVRHSIDDMPVYLLDTTYKILIYKFSHTTRCRSQMMIDNAKIVHQKKMIELKEKPNGCDDFVANIKKNLKKASKNFNKHSKTINLIYNIYNVESPSL